MNKAYLRAMQARLTEEETDMLKRIYAPQVVGIPLSDARKDVCILPDGEIRAYGGIYPIKRFEHEKYGYLSSTDCGLTWKLHYASSDMNGSYLYLDEKKSYVSVFFSEEGTFAKLSDIGPDDDHPRIVKISDGSYRCAYLPQKSDFSDRIWSTGERSNEDEYCVAGYFYSDDFGESWKVVELPLPPKQEVIYPHKGPRWNHGCGTEPHVCELDEHTMMMIIRNSTDFFYASYSHDGGETWSEPEPSEFHGTDTTAYLLRLEDGRTIALWNNTQPLSEVRHENQRPPLDPTVLHGRWEDVFTNRDANHAAITEDGGKSWIGYRELHLNDIRNNADFRYAFDHRTAGDKSVHQFQAFELPYNKVLVAMGQNEASRRFVIFDIDWLYEKDRSEDFIDGLLNVSTQVYVRSVAGCTVSYNGHCAYNRTNGALMMPDPENESMEVVLISKHRDERLLSELQGVTWNFPASVKGEVTAECRLIGGKVRFTLADRWFNPSDEEAGYLAPFYFELDAGDLPEGYATVGVRYDTGKGMAEVTIDGEFRFAVRMRECIPAGLSYLLLQSVGDGDCEGVYVRRMDKKAIQ